MLVLLTYMLLVALQKYLGMNLKVTRCGCLIGHCAALMSVFSLLVTCLSMHTDAWFLQRASEVQEQFVRRRDKLFQFGLRMQPVVVVVVVGNLTAPAAAYVVVDEATWKF